jgi:hypothetical protein
LFCLDFLFFLVASQAQLNWQTVPSDVMYQALVNASESDVKNTMNSKTIFSSGALKKKSGRVGADPLRVDMTRITA